MARIAVVTGGTRGIGAAISKSLKGAGYTVAVLQLSESAPELALRQAAAALFKNIVRRNWVRCRQHQRRPAAA